jgi:hypothetical protein
LVTGKVTKTHCNGGTDLVPFHHVSAKLRDFPNNNYPSS